MKIAALTMVFNERHFLPFWILHYGAVVGRENLYIVDDGSDDGSTTGLGAIKVMRNKKSVLDESDRAGKIAAIQAELLTRYDAVIFSDVDELIVVDPKLNLGLAEYITGHVDTVARATGLNVHFSLHYESPLKRGVPLFRQRRFVQFDQEYCKTLVSRVPLQWTPGFHNCSVHTDPRSDLFLFHLRSVDPGISVDRINSFHKISRSQRSIEAHESGHFGWTERSYLAHFYFTEKSIFDAALAETHFEETIDALLGRLLVSDDKALIAARQQLMLLPQRFADTIAVPARVAG